MYDLHDDKIFTVKDFRVAWVHGMNHLVSPYYPESGGTVIDWMEDDAWVDDDQFDVEDFDDDGDNDPTDFDDDDIPFWIFKGR